MNSIWTQIVIQTVLRQKERTTAPQQDYTPLEIARGYRQLRIIILNFLRDIIFMASGVASAAFGLESFLVPNKFIDGGATGISLLVSELTSVPLSILLLIINIPFLVLGFNVINRQFAIKAALTITALAIVIATVHFPEVTHDKLLVAVFGGFFLGAGIGLSVRGAPVLDG